MNEEWRNRVLALSDYYHDDSVARQFYLTVLQGTGNCDLDDVRTLLKTFTEHEDYGVQEGVVSVLDAAPREIYLKALLERLPSLLNTAPRWAISLIGTELESNTEALAKAVVAAPEDAKQALLMLLRDEDFRVAVFQTEALESALSKRFSGTGYEL